MDIYTVVILLTLVGFFALAALLLFPVYFFLKKEERVAQKWTKDALARRMREERMKQTGGPNTTGGQPGDPATQPSS